MRINPSISKSLRLGLPVKCQAKFLEDGVALQSLVPEEEKVVDHAKDEKAIFKRFKRCTHISNENI